MNKYFPFKVKDAEGDYTIAAHIENPELFPLYVDFFEKHGYSGNGYCWEGHIVQILEKIEPEILNRVEFDPEAGAFFAHAYTKETQIKFVELLSPIFADLEKLETYVSQADRDRIDD